MKPVLTSREMAQADRAAIEELRTGETRLMELAGRETANLIAALFDGGDRLEGRSFLVVCGKGSNGYGAWEGSIAMQGKVCFYLS